MRYAILAAFVALGAGCVPVTEPVGDIDKAEPDKALVGEWTDPRDNAKLTIDVPAVKGNPKGLMRGIEDDPKKAIWFFTATVGKHNYASILAEDKASRLVQFAAEGDYAAWQKAAKKRFVILKYTVEADKFVFVGVEEKVWEKFMKAEKIPLKKADEFYYETPAGWLEKYLAKNDPKTIFDGTVKQEYQRPKKK